MNLILLTVITTFTIILYGNLSIFDVNIPEAKETISKFHEIEFLSHTAERKYTDISK